jgi:hypothetical protein
MNINEPVRPLSDAEKHLVKHIDKAWSRDYALSELKAHLQIAIEIELATIPIYLYAYYSIDRTPAAMSFPQTPISRFADKAGAVIMSVAVEEMLHMSLASNILFSLGQQPQLYLRSPSLFPSNLPGHAKLAPNAKPMSIPLATFSVEQLTQFLEIEYPSASDAPPESGNWDTIGQIYSYIRCIISSCHIHDKDFHVGKREHQIHNGNYSPNNIDTVYPTETFNHTCPVPAAMPHSAAKVAALTSAEDSHSGSVALVSIDSCERALQAIQTIDSQGEGYGPSKFDDASKHELSHYYKFLSLQSHLVGYDPKSESLPRLPKPPAPAAQQYSVEQLRTIVFNFPSNPVAASYPAGRSDVANVVSGLYQYMLIMTESIFLQEPSQQKVYFNQALHRSMIWILDKIIQAMRQVNLLDVNTGTFSYRLAPTFENVDLGPRDQAFANLVNMCTNLNATYGGAAWYTAGIQYYVLKIPSLYDVSTLWSQAEPGCSVAKYKGIPKFPPHPPRKVASDEVRHACMGLNSCKGQGRTRENACAGQGYCSTALEYNYSDATTPLVSDHTCHVLNDCRSQGGCGLYGTGAEQENPGANGCATLGSCATPINAERFSTDGRNTGKSVWTRAREVFAEKTWPELVKANPSLPPVPPLVPPHDLFKYGPTIEWIHDYSGEGMTACGASGMSGAGSCA